MRGWVYLGDEAGVAEMLEVFVVANAVGIKPGIRHQVGFPGFPTEAKVVEISAQDIGNRDRVTSNAVRPLNAAQLDDKRDEVFTADMLQHRVRENEVHRCCRDALERFKTVGEVLAVAGPHNVVEIGAIRQGRRLQSHFPQVEFE